MRNGAVWVAWELPNNTEGGMEVDWINNSELWIFNSPVSPTDLFTFLGNPVGKIQKSQKDGGEAVLISAEITHPEVYYFGVFGRQNYQSFTNYLFINEDDLEPYSQALEHYWKASGEYPGGYSPPGKANIWTDYFYYFQELNTTQSAQPLSTPTGLYADNITSDSARTNWQAVENASNYKVQYKAAGDTVWTETYTD